MNKNIYGHSNLITKSHYNMRKKNRIEKKINEANQKWLNPRKYYINSLINHSPLNRCPECGGEIEYTTEDEDEAYCRDCGLITSASSCYVAGVKIDLPFGIRLQ